MYSNFVYLVWKYFLEFFKNPLFVNEIHKSTFYEFETTPNEKLARMNKLGNGMSGKTVFVSALYLQQKRGCGKFYCTIIY